MDECDPGNLNSTIFIDACSYIRNRSTCTFNTGFFNYFEWQYCAFDNRAVPTFLKILLLIVMFLTVAISADSFFAPCLVVVARMLRMSQNIAGVTLLALANGAPDVFSALSAILSSGTPNISLALGSIFGSGILVNTIAAGVIMIVCPFDVMRRPVVKDLIFYFISIIWCIIILIRKKIELWSSLVLLLTYVLYVFVTAISRFIFVRYFDENSPRNQTVDIQMDNIEESEMSNIAEEKSEQSEYVLGGDNVEILSNTVRTSGDKEMTLSSTAYTAEHYNNSHSVAGFYDNKAMVIDGDRISSMKTSAIIRHLRRVPSSSHRNTGFLARLIIESEHQRQSSSSKENELPITKRRARSLSTTNCQTRRNIRFGSDGERDKKMDKDTVTHTEDMKTLQIKSTKEVKLNDGTSVWIDGFEEKKIESDKIVTDESEGVYIEFPGIFKHFLLTICPIDLNEWSDQSLLSKIQSILQSPIIFILTMTIPVIDDTAFTKGWCKLLNALHCVISPMICIVFIKANLYPIHQSTFLVQHLVLILGFLLCCVILITSKADQPPPYHFLFAFLGFCTSVAWIYELANEIVNILEVYRVVFSIPETILGLSVLAFANSIGDLVSNITLSKKGYPRIGYIACIGGPLFNLLIGFGMPFLIVVSRNGSISFDIPSETIVLVFTAMFITTMNIIALPILRFHLIPLYGTVLIVIYCLFLIFVLLFASKVINV